MRAHHNPQRADLDQGRILVLCLIKGRDYEEVVMIKKITLAFVAAAFLAAPVLAQTAPAPAAPGAAPAAPMAQKKAGAKMQAKHKAKPKRFGGRD
jgi:hypothetical protein